MYCGASHSRATDAGDKGIGLASTANANGATFASNTFVANVNIATAIIKMATGLVTQGDVALAATIVSECARTDGYVAIAISKMETGLVTQGDVALAANIVFECLRTDGCVAIAVGEIESAKSDSCVIVSTHVSGKCKNTGSRVSAAANVVMERRTAGRGIVVAIEVSTEGIATESRVSAAVR